jgi:hypothetical protein
MIKRKSNQNNNGGQVGGVLKNGKRSRTIQSDD